MGYSVLIVDDEVVIREGLKKHIRWGELGFDSVRTAGSAEDALNLCREQMPDLLVTDICMGGKDGLDLTEEVSCGAGGPTVIIISSYDDFRYAQRAVKYKAVREYILKPIDPFAFQDTIREIVSELRQKQDTAGSSLPSLSMPEPRTQLVRACLKLAQAQYADRNFGLAQAAEVLEVTPNYLSGRFKEETGVSFTRYLLHLQIEQAKSLLADPVNRIYQVSSQVGFSDEKYFSRQFKQIVGMTPKEWRNQLRDADVSE